VSEARSTSLSFDDALRIARESVAKVEPGAPLVAAVVRLRSDSHALERPEKYNFYFKSSGVTPYWRVGFPDGDRNAMETKRDEEDGLILGVEPLGEWKASWQQALTSAEKLGGQGFRSSARTWLVRIALTQEPEVRIPLYRTLYSSGSIVGQPAVDIAIDATTGAPPADEHQIAIARVQARTALGGPVVLTGASAFWRADAPPNLNGFGATRPVSTTLSFQRADQDDRRVVSTFFGERSGTQVGQSSVRLAPLPDQFDLITAFLAVEDAGGRALREEWARAGSLLWSAGASVVTPAESGLFVRVSYSRTSLVAPSGPVSPVEFRYDLATGRVTRIP
jgi:hypothetical protein